MSFFLEIWHDLTTEHRGKRPRKRSVTKKIHSTKGRARVERILICSAIADDGAVSVDRVQRLLCQAGDVARNTISI